MVWKVLENSFIGGIQEPPRKRASWNNFPQTRASFPLNKNSVHSLKCLFPPLFTSSHIRFNCCCVRILPWFLYSWRFARKEGCRQAQEHKRRDKVTCEGKKNAFVAAEGVVQRSTVYEWNSQFCIFKFYAEGIPKGKRTKLHIVRYCWIRDILLSSLDQRNFSWWGEHWNKWLQCPINLPKTWKGKIDSQQDD